MALRAGLDELMGSARGLSFMAGEWLRYGIAFNPRRKETCSDPYPFHRRSKDQDSICRACAGPRMNTLATR
jgi:hypothetical protein